jgi:hypothetical protein
LHSSRDRSRRYWKVQGRRWDMQVMIIWFCKLSLKQTFVFFLGLWKIQAQMWEHAGFLHSLTYGMNPTASVYVSLFLAVCESQLAQLRRVAAGRNVSPDLPPRLLVLDHCDWSAVHWCVFTPFCNFSRQIAGKLTKCMIHLHF